MSTKSSLSRYEEEKIVGYVGCLVSVISTPFWKAEVGWSSADAHPRYNQNVCRIVHVSQVANVRNKLRFIQSSRLYAEMVLFVTSRMAVNTVVKVQQSMTVASING